MSRVFGRVPAGAGGARSFVRWGGGVEQTWNDERRCSMDQDTKSGLRAASPAWPELTEPPAVTSF